jgi:ferredoxin
MREKKIMRVYVVQDLCISCGSCVDICPLVFDWNNEEKAFAIVDEVPSELESDALEALHNCPTEAILEK